MILILYIVDNNKDI